MRENIVQREKVNLCQVSFNEKTGKNGYSMRLEGLSIRRLPWNDMRVWYKDYLEKKQILFEKKIAEARATVADLVKAVKVFKEDYGQSPASSDLLVERAADMNRSWAIQDGHSPYIRGGWLSLDPRGQPYQYLVPDRYDPESFDIWSFRGISRDPDLWIGNWEAKITKK